MERSKEDREAFRALVNEIGPVLAAFLHRRVADTNELEDVCQETLLQIYESRHTYSAHRPLEPWLFAIAQHVSTRHFHRYLLRANRETLSYAPEASATCQGQLVVKLRDLLRRLPQFQSEAFVMMKVEGLTFDEASRRTSTSIGTPKARVHRTCASIKKALAE
ncbi:MAG: RNA polymerase sigma factor [Candidatus Binataceae bacterium]